MGASSSCGRPIKIAKREIATEMAISIDEIEAAHTICYSRLIEGKTLSMKVKNIKVTAPRNPWLAQLPW